MSIVPLHNLQEIADNYGRKDGDVFKGIDMPPTRYYAIADDFKPGDTRFGHRYDAIPDFEHKHTDLQEGSVVGVLNHGFVEVQEVQGSDEAIIGAARTSYATSNKSSGDEVLLRYLMRHSHTTPFEMAGIKVRMYLPIVVYRQLFRHRTAVQLEPEFLSNDSAFQRYSVQNEMSGRYVELPDHFYVPEPRHIKKQSTTNKQGGEDGFTLSEQISARALLYQANITARETYNQLLEMGVAKETARNGLPLTQYTLLVWKIDLKNMLHFLGLRLDKHAQWEVRQYAEAMGMMIARFFPLTWKAFSDYHLHAMKFSRVEAESLLGNVPEEFLEQAFKEFCNTVSNKREQQEFRAKLGL
jgi:thymidylate synthase (FAD)